MSDHCPKCGKPFQPDDCFCSACGAAHDVQNEAVVFTIKPGSTRLDVSEEAFASPHKRPSRREQLAARRLCNIEAKEGVAADYVYPVQKPRRQSSLSTKILSLLLVLVAIACAVGILALRQYMERTAFAVVQSAYTALSEHDWTTLDTLFLDATDSPDSISAAQNQMQDYWSEYGKDVSFQLTLEQSAFLFGEKKQDALSKLNTEDAPFPTPAVLLHFSYAVSISQASPLPAEAYVGHVNGKWVLLQETVSS